MLSTLKRSIRSIPDFPKKGILFRDITPLLLDPEKFKYCIGHFASLVKTKIDTVVSIESRGFIFGSALAYALRAGFVPVRKEGKLPFRKFRADYELEYGKNVLEIHVDAIRRGSKVVLIDDVLATGGTAEGVVKLVEKLGGKVEKIGFLIELDFLKGRQKLAPHPVFSLIQY